MSENFPMVFRTEQIESFLTKGREINKILGPKNEEFADSHIEMVLEEVAAHESDLSAARVSIAVYLNDEIAKDPDNPIFHRLRDAFTPLFNEVIQIEVKMYGQPKYQISTENNTATAWRMDAAAIADVTLPQDVLAESAKYGFTSVLPADFMLPDQEPTIMDYRRSFFEALPVDEDSTVDRERDWLKNFKKEANFELLDRALFICNFHDQVSTMITDGILKYCLEEERTPELLEYENNCDVPEVDLVPSDFIVTASNPAKRALFSALYLTGGKQEDFKKFIEGDFIEFARKELEMPADSFVGTADAKVQRWENGEVVAEAYTKAIKSLVKMYGKHPLFEEDLFGFKAVFRFLKDDAPNMLSHFYRCFNDMHSYYEERQFLESATNCELLKDYITELQPQEAEPTQEEVNQANEEAADKRAAAASSGIFIE